MYLTKDDFTTLLDATNSLYSKLGKTEEVEQLFMVIHNTQVSDDKTKQRVRKYVSDMRKIDSTYGHRERADGTVITSIK